MPQKILVCASTASHILNFHLPYLESFHRQGDEVWVAVEREAAVPCADRVVVLPFRKRLLSLQNVRAVFAAWRLLRRERFSLLCTHTTLAGAVVRAAVLLLPPGGRPAVVHTCHGYPFKLTDGVKKWAYLLPERLCARVTDTLLVMNGEDERIARRYRLYGGRLCRIPGMGVDLRRFAPLDDAVRQRGRARLGLAPGDVALLCVAEFSSRKNQRLLLRAFAAARLPRAVLILAGEGAQREGCMALADRLGLAGRVRFPGQVREIETLFPLCDVLVSASLSEGLPFNVMEGMACALPAAASRVKGHVDLVEDGVTGLLFDPGEEETLVRALQTLCGDAALRGRMGRAARQAVARYGRGAVFPEVLGLYRGEPQKIAEGRREP